MGEPLRHNLYSAASFFERYILSIIYFRLAYVEWGWLNEVIRGWPHGEGILSPSFAYGSEHLINAVMQLLVGAFLLNSRPAVMEPRNLREILVPLAACFYFVLYTVLLPRLPLYWRSSPFGNQIRGPLAIIGLILTVIGPVISLWAAITLGKSYGIFITVRKIVMRGPYRYVRHPIYLGYFFLETGFLLANMSRAVFILVPIHLLLFVWRARLEEARLAEASPAYREHMRRTGFLLPRRLQNRLMAPVF